MWLPIGVAMFILGLKIRGKVYMDNQRAQVEQSFDKVLAMHPTININLMNFYDTEEASS